MIFSDKPESDIVLLEKQPSQDDDDLDLLSDQEDAETGEKVIYDLTKMFHYVETFITRVGDSGRESIRNDS